MRETVLGCCQENNAVPVCVLMSFTTTILTITYIFLLSPNNGDSVIKLLVGNKIDLDRQVERERADAWARSHGMLFLEASAKTRLGIRQVFMEVVQKILENPDALANAVPGKPKLQIKRPVESHDEEDDNGCC
jgi:Ras-related protein Rab-18